MLTFEAMRAANATRQKEWDPNGKGTLEFFTVELGGEVGEALNLIKKIMREEMGIRGSRASKEDLGKELADVVLCADLVAITMGFIFVRYTDFNHMRAESWNNGGVTAGRLGIVLGRYLGEVFDNVMINDYSHTGAALLSLIRTADMIAEINGIDLGQTVIDKFNETSTKYGLNTRMARAA